MNNEYFRLAASMIMPRLDVEEFNSSAEYRNRVYEFTDAGIAGFCVFKGNAKAVRSITSELRSRAGKDLFFAADFEHGLRMRLEDGTSFPHAMALGKCSPQVVENIASVIATEASSIGINWNFAPVCDINSNINNPIINIRSFGESVSEVEPAIISYIKGIQSGGIMACAKHFPGHGDVDIDSHLALPTLNKALNILQNNEIKPFKSAIDVGVKSIMMAHLLVPSMNEPGMPSSISKKAVDYLRRELGFEGLVVTDALDMHSISDNFGADSAFINAVRAGIDVLLLPSDPMEAIRAISEEADRDIAIRENLENSAERMIKAMAWIRKGNRKNDFPENFSFPEHEKLALNAAWNSISISGLTDLLPIEEEANIAGFAFCQGDDIQPGINFFNMLAQAIQNECDFGFIDEQITFEEINSLKSRISDAKLLLFAVFYRSRAYKGSVGLPEKLNDAVNILSDGRPRIIILFGSPYISESLKPDCLIKAYSDSLPSIAAVVMKLSGRELNADII